MGTSPELRHPKSILLASQKEPKIRGSIEAIREVFPAESRLRRFVTVRDLKEKDSTNQSKIQVYEYVEQRGELTSRVATLYEGAQLPKAQLHDKIFDGVFPGVQVVQLYAQDSESFVNPQPVKEHLVYHLDEGFEGALNRVDYVRKRNAVLPDPISYDYIFGIENALVVFTAKNRGEERKIVQDIGFVVVEDAQGNQAFGTSAGVIFGEKRGEDFFALSAETQFNKPAGHFYSSENPQDPHIKATHGLYSRAELLIPAIAIPLIQLSSK